MRLTDLLALSHVPRWAVVRHHRSQSVADHSYRVAVIYIELCDRLGILPAITGLMLAMFHDGPESRSGDISGLFKKHIKEEVDRVERVVCPWIDRTVTISNHRNLVKIADLIETYTFIQAEGYGPHADAVKDKVWNQLMEYPDSDREAIRSICRDITTEAER